MSRREENVFETGVMKYSPTHLYEYDLDTQKTKAITQNPRFNDTFFQLSSNENLMVMTRKSEEGSPELWIYDTQLSTLKNLEIKGENTYLN